MMVGYRLEAGIATITMDDGKVNVMSSAMIAELNAALDRAAADRATVVLTGREGVFSAGFDLPVLRAAGASAVEMIRAGFELAERVLAFPTPVIVACTGHAVAMGAFLVLSADYRIGAAGSYRLVANEVAIGVTLPRAAVEILRQRLAPAYFNRAATLSEPFSPATAVESGFLDRVVDVDELQDAAREVAATAARLDQEVYHVSKLRTRRWTLDAPRAAIEADHAEFTALAGA